MEILIPHRGTGGGTEGRGRRDNSWVVNGTKHYQSENDFVHNTEEPAPRARMNTIGGGNIFTTIAKHPDVDGGESDAMRGVRSRGKTAKH
jgi:hypothetical protein